MTAARQGAPRAGRAPSAQSPVAGAENLSDHESFASAVMLALEAARRTSSAEKLGALRNAALNSVAPGAPEEYQRPC